MAVAEPQAVFRLCFSLSSSCLTRERAGVQREERRGKTKEGRRELTEVFVQLSLLGFEALACAAGVLVLVPLAPRSRIDHLPGSEKNERGGRRESVCVCV